MSTLGNVPVNEAINDLLNDYGFGRTIIQKVIWKSRVSKDFRASWKDNYVVAVLPSAFDIKETR